MLASEGLQSGLYDLGHRDYWSRLWVVQEIVLAQSMGVHCGKYETALQDILWGWSNLLEIIMMKPECFSVAFDLVPAHSAFQAFTWTKSIDLSANPKACMLDVLNTLGKLSGRRTSDPRDYIYACISLLPPSLDIVPDYSQSVVMTFAAAAVKILNWSHSLALLQCTGVDNCDQQLPSWVPNFGERRDGPLVEEYRASGDVPTYVAWDGGTRPSVHALFVDEVLEIEHDKLRAIWLRVNRARLDEIRKLLGKRSPVLHALESMIYNSRKWLSTTWAMINTIPLFCSCSQFLDSTFDKFIELSEALRYDQFEDWLATAQKALDTAIFDELRRKVMPAVQRVCQFQSKHQRPGLSDREIL